MSTDELERFLTSRERKAVNAFLAEASQDSDDFDVLEALDRNLYEALSHHDERAGLSRWLELRFTGAKASGRMAESAVSDVLGAFRREVVGASRAKDADKLGFDLVGFSEGSVVLHLVPAQSADVDPGDLPADDQPALTAADDPIDQALSVITELHDTVESSGDILRFSGRESLLKGFSALADVLDKHDLDMGITWRNRAGVRRRSALTSQGREFARTYLDRSDKSDIITITGRIVELNISGSFEIKVGAALKGPRYKIDTESEADLLGMHLELGQTITVRARRIAEQNKLGVTFSVRYKHLDTLTADQELPFEH